MREKKQKKPGRGRPTSWKEEYIHTVKRLCILGATLEEIADAFNVTQPTVWGWTQKYPEFKQAIYEGRTTADSDVAVSLYKSAVGFYNKETKVFIVDNKPLRVEVDKYNPPNPTSAIFFLKNRRPDLWNDKRVIQNVDKNDQIDEIKRIIVYPKKDKDKEKNQ